MPSNADKETDERLNALEKKISEMYKSASEEMQKYTDDYYNHLDTFRYDRENLAKLTTTLSKDEVAEKWAELYGNLNGFNAWYIGANKAYGSTEAEAERNFRAWYATQVQRGAGYQELTDKLATRMTEANKVASAYVNDDTPSIYSLNYNAEASIINDAYPNVRFDIYNEQAVKNLITGKENVTEFGVMENGKLTYRRLQVDAVKNYNWNTEQINKAVTSAILQGQGIKELSSAFLSVMGRNEKSAIRNARTAYTSAQNAGKNACYEQANAKGIKVMRQWRATHDARTRDSHIAIDGEIRAIGEAFSNGLMYPADSNGAPEEVYNCRCALKGILPKSLTEEANKATKAVNNAKKVANNVTNTAKSSKIDISKITTYEEAKKVAKDVLGIDLKDLEKANMDILRGVLQVTEKVYSIFGNLHEAGMLNAISYYPKRVQWAGAYSYPWRQVFLRCVTAKNAVKTLRKEAEFAKNVGWWSCGDEMATIKHELGHAVEHKFLEQIGGNPYGNSKAKEIAIENLRAKIQSDCGIDKWVRDPSKEDMAKAGAFLSYYGLRNTGEFIAESVAEYLTGNPRETAQKVVEILLGA